MPGRVPDWVLAALAGALLILAFPLFNVDALAWAALVPLLWAVHDASPRRAFLLGLVTGSVAYLGIIYWIAGTLMTFGHIPLPLSILLLVCLVLYLGSYVGLFASSYAFVVSRTGLSPLAVAPVLWVASEHLKTYVIGGFPWASLGYSQHLRLPIIQIADITAVYGVSFVVALVNAGLFVTARALVGLHARRRALVEVVMVIAILCGVLGYGYWRLDGLRGLEAEGKPLRVALIQGNIDQERKWNRDFQGETIGIYADLSREAAREGADLIAWPETAAPFYFQSDARMGPTVREIASSLEAYLLFGAPAFRYGDSGTRYFNRAYQVGPDGQNAGQYDKLHLVLFGEYNPLPFITKLVEGAGDFTPGKELKTFHHPGGDYGVMICFEGIFPADARRYVDAGARFLVNITNDAWFGDTSAPYQHLSMVAFRAVENRVPVVRAANTGITAVIAQDGRVTAQTGLFERTWLTGTIRVTDRTTFYARQGDIFVWLTSACAMLLLLWSFVLKYRSR